jgi:hypothetical protein
MEFRIQQTERLSIFDWHKRWFEKELPEINKALESSNLKLFFVSKDLHKAAQQKKDHETI